MITGIDREDDRGFAMEPIKPPMPVHVRDIQNFARLALGLTEGSQMIWSFKHKSSNILAFFTAYMYWDGDIPILAYTEADFDENKPFLAYKSDSPKGEEWQFSDEADDTRYKYASLINVKTCQTPSQRASKATFRMP